ncbi:BlaI/MecI/CopY family transcriptional regulator [Thermosediminibacter oceani]|uniref:Transcriptional repressor, CopY family n=1 Tax=Thermosediminibacter oceani (strain ATCC BAA-1034 / DSM 16646 / JW/IW-1228P) TaxID=555079 RepID=D9S0U6_THEOJ|nr:BlaI/MecI/CopY family transcriptional regulator [Thermosediminibacter oceani]ADL07110.1 transcriptional repressor, CopY family [Thermosediminibacter oceani DSM 16646]
MKKLQRISDAEKQIMEYIWKAGRPVTTSEIMRNLPEDKAWKQNTVVTFLTRLMKKGILKATRIGKANYYEPCVTEQEYRNFVTKQFINDVHKGSVLGFITALCDNGDLTKEDIESILKRLKE